LLLKIFVLAALAAFLAEIAAGAFELLDDLQADGDTRGSDYASRWTR
jgi:hypothetical protein